MLVHNTVQLQIHKQISPTFNTLMVGATVTILAVQVYVVNLLQLIIKPVHIQVGFSLIVGVELHQPGCTLMVAVHVVHRLMVFVNRHYDGLILKLVVVNTK